MTSSTKSKIVSRVQSSGLEHFSQTNLTEKSHESLFKIAVEFCHPDDAGSTKSQSASQGRVWPETRIKARPSSGNEVFVTVFSIG